MLRSTAPTLGICWHKICPYSTTRRVPASLPRCALVSGARYGGCRVGGKVPKASCLSHFKSRFFNLREALGASRIGSIQVGQEIGMSKDRGRSPCLVHANAHNGTLFALLS